MEEKERKYIMDYIVYIEVACLTILHRSLFIERDNK
jgi:hypothetical protein